MARLQHNSPRLICRLHVRPLRGFTSHLSSRHATPCLGFISRQYESDHTRLHLSTPKSYLGFTPLQAVSHQANSRLQATPLQHSPRHASASTHATPIQFRSHLGFSQSVQYTTSRCTPRLHGIAAQTTPFHFSASAQGNPNQRASHHFSASLQATARQTTAPLGFSECSPDHATSFLGFNPSHPKTPHTSAPITALSSQLGFSAVQNTAEQSSTPNHLIPAQYKPRLQRHPIPFQVIPRLHSISRSRLSNGAGLQSTTRDSTALLGFKPRHSTSHQLKPRLHRTPHQSGSALDFSTVHAPPLHISASHQSISSHFTPRLHARSSQSAPILDFNPTRPSTYHISASLQDSTIQSKTRLHLGRRNTGPKQISASVRALARLPQTSA